MASKNVLQIIQKKIGPFPAALLHAFLEWVLIIILFLDGLLFFVATEFACLVGLEIPCLLCTRIDHVLVCGNSDSYYKKSICMDHGKYVSSLAYCHTHQGLADARRMCRNCLASLMTNAAAERRTSSDIFRSLVGISGGGPLECSVDAKGRIHLKFRIGRGKGCRSGEEKRGGVCQCSCCGEPLRTLVLPDGTEVPEIPIPSRAVNSGHRSSKGSKDWHSFDAGSSNVGYRDLRLMSDTESEIAVTDVSSVIATSEIDIDKDEVISAGSKKSGEGLDGKTESEASVNVREEPLSLIEPRDRDMATDGSGSTVKDRKISGLGHGLEELTWDKDLLSHPSDSTSGTAVGPSKPNNQSHIERAKSIGLDEAYAMATGNKPYGFPLTDHSSTSQTPPGLPVLRKRLSIGKDRAVVEKVGSMGKVNWKSLLHRLKRQVCLDRKSLIALSTELDQERSASAVAANQAMAMITRLQEEKAAVRMEALQYQRMMEEQAEYDQEALQVMSDLLIKREKKINNLEERLEAYRQTLQFESANKRQVNEDVYYAGVGRNGYKVPVDKDLMKLRSSLNSSSSGEKSDSRSSINLGVMEENDAKHEHFLD
ncbi:probable myosin-binding protein 5 [Magnolia sinica]|uniref:probable myosin-binding protein 5 n=1 Tax=Magnolia sinica TaxID=86752 RepID=UPI00265907A6|nr:probable myosin-binding protein 5 [Magnolia sinica]